MEEKDLELQPASFKKRMLASLLDLIIEGFLAILVTGFLVMIGFVPTLFIVFFVLFWVIFHFLNAVAYQIHTGRTFGKWITGLKVCYPNKKIDVHNEDIIKREVSKLWTIVTGGYSFFSNYKKEEIIAFHDEYSKTVVLNLSEEHEEYLYEYYYEEFYHTEEEEKEYQAQKEERERLEKLEKERIKQEKEYEKQLKKEQQMKLKEEKKLQKQLEQQNKGVQLQGGNVPSGMPNPNGMGQMPNMGVNPNATGQTPNMGMNPMVGVVAGMTGMEDGISESNNIPQDMNLNDLSGDGFTPMGDMNQMNPMNDMSNNMQSYNNTYQLNPNDLNPQQMNGNMPYGDMNNQYYMQGQPGFNQNPTGFNQNPNMYGNPQMQNTGETNQKGKKSLLNLFKFNNPKNNSVGAEHYESKVSEFAQDNRYLPSQNLFSETYRGWNSDDSKNEKRFSKITDK